MLYLLERRVYKLFGILLHRRRILLPGYLFIQSHVYISMDSGICIVYFRVESNSTLFCCSSDPTWAIGSNFHWFWNPFNKQLSMQCVVLLFLLCFVRTDPYFLPLSRCSRLIFPATSQNYPFLQEDLFLETNIQLLGMFLAIFLFFISSLSTKLHFAYPEINV